MMGTGKRRTRLIAWFTMTILCFAFLMGRLVQLQLVETEHFSKYHINLIEASVGQRTKAITIHDGRGGFLDFKGRPLTHEYYPSLVLFPFLKQIDWPSDKVAEILGVSKWRLEQAVEKEQNPFVFGGKNPYQLTDLQMKEINSLKIPGVYAINKQYKVKEGLAEHFIGIIGENNDLLMRRYKEKVDHGELALNTKIGVTGMQKVFDELLLPEAEEKLLYHVDMRGGPLFGLDVKYLTAGNAFYPVNIETTIDRDIQQVVEDAVDRNQLLNGGVVILDVETSDIRALVSRSNGNRTRKSGTSPNYMYLSQTPGSVFKVVTAAAAIEEAIDYERNYNCDLNLYGDGPDPRKLGQLTFSESFAQSCNYTFASLAGELLKRDKNIVEQYAEKLGLIGPVGWQGNVFHMDHFKQLDGEAQGQIWANEDKMFEKNSMKAVAQTAIGQKNVRTTPVAIANMMATIAREGEKKQVRSATRILYKNGAEMYEFPEQQLSGPTIRTDTARKLQELLREVVKEGTGRAFARLPYEIAGKSGTAQIADSGRVNKWFAGYFPADNPKYAFVVVDLDVNSGDAKTTEVLKDIVSQIFQLENGGKQKGVRTQNRIS